MLKQKLGVKEEMEGTEGEIAKSHEKQRKRIKAITQQRSTKSMKPRNSVKVLKGKTNNQLLGDQNELDYNPAEDIIDSNTWLDQQLTFGNKETQHPRGIFNHHNTLSSKLSFEESSNGRKKLAHITDIKEKISKRSTKAKLTK